MEKLKIDDFVNYKFISNVKYSKNSKYIVFILHEVHLKSNGYDSNIWIYNTETKEKYKLTLEGTVKEYTILDDNIHIAYLVGSEVEIVNIEDKNVEYCFDVDMRINKLQEVREGQFLFTSENVVGKVSNDEGDCVIIDEIPFLRNGVGEYVNKCRNQLYLYTVETNKCELLTPELFNVDFFELKDDKSKIVISGQYYEKKKLLFNQLYIYDLKANIFERISPDGDFEYTDVHFYGDNIVYVGRSMKRYGVNENVRIYTLDLSTKESECITKDLDVGMQNIVGTDCSYGLSSFTYSIKKDGDNFYFISTEGYNSYINKMDKRGNIERIVGADGAVCNYTVVNGKLAYVAFRDLKLQEVYELIDGKEVQLTDFNGWILDERKLSKPEHMTVKTDVDVVIDGWIMKPVDFDEKKKYPAILDIHGGPKTTYGEIFVHEMQYWANEGYVVFYCNPRGSDGKGDAFADIRGKHGTIDYEDIMKFTDYVISNYSFIDSERVGITGGSYGGFMTNWIVGHTDRFKAAATQRSIANWISDAYASDIGYFFEKDQHLADPWTNVDVMWDHSPMKYADRVKTPLLFIHSEQDYRCELSQAFQFYTALKCFDVETKMCIFKGENHELSRSGKPKNRIRRLKEITNWFDKLL